MTRITEDCEECLWEKTGALGENLPFRNRSATFPQYDWPNFLRNEVERPSLGSRSPPLETELGAAVFGSHSPQKITFTEN